MMESGPGTASRRSPLWGASLAGLAAILLGAGVAGAGEIERNIEALVGRAAAELMAREYGTIDNPLLKEWVNRTGQRVAAQCPRQEFPYRFRILDTPQRNAYALPGAHIFVTRGLLAGLGSDDELAAILGHEVGHVGDRDFQRVVARQLMFLGVGVIIERADHEELLTPLRVVQLFNTLRHSRRQEDQADQRGVEYAFAARYDPVALTAFHEAILGKRSHPRAWYEGVLDTHPDAYKRLVRCRERSRRLKCEQPENLAVLAEDLHLRYRYGAALENYTLLAEVEPASTRPLLGLARLHLARGEPDLCIERCRATLALNPDDPDARALLGKAELARQDGPQASRDRPPPTRGPRDRSRPSMDLEWQVIDRLGELGRRLAEDRKFNDALSWAQAWRPETGDWRWLYVLAKTRLLLMAADRLRWKVAEVGGLAASGARAWDDLGRPPDDGAEAKEAIMWYNGGARAAVRGAEELAIAMDLLPPVLATLALTGSRDPFGRMSSSRFALMETDLLIAEAHARRALELCRAAARDVAAAEVRRLALALGQLARRADGPRVVLCEGLAGVRLGKSPEQVSGRAVEAGGLGLACWRLADESARAQTAGASSDEATYEQVETVRIVLKLLLKECQTETTAGADGEHGGT